MIRPIDHRLMDLWVMAGEGHHRDDHIHGHDSLSAEESVMVDGEARRLGFLVGNGQEARLTEAGETQARRLVRRHRLAERLLSDLLELSEEEFETSACRFEHSLSDAATERICTILGHPTQCPHGRPIPAGACCRDRLRVIEPIVERLSDLRPGDEAQIVFLSPVIGERLGRLSGLGIVPGSRVRLRRKSPAFVFDCGQTEIAAEEEMVREIFVMRTDAAAAPTAPAATATDGTPAAPNPAVRR